MRKTVEKAYASDFAVGATYETWGGKLITLKSYCDGVFYWSDETGELGSTTVRGLASRVRREINK